jgi:tetratricopeptide (TPR) repeat protein
MQINMNNLKYLIFALVIGLVSCEDYFEVDNKDSVNGGDYYKSRTEVATAVMGIHSLVQNIADNNIILSSLLSEEGEPGVNATNWITELNNRQISELNPLVDQTEYYKIIVNCNDLLARLDTIDLKKVGYTKHEAEGILTQVTTIRAWTYFTLSNFFNEVVYFKSPLVNFSMENLNKLPRLNQDQVVQRLLDEMESRKGKVGEVNWGKILGDNDKLWNNMNVPYEVLYADLNLFANNYEEALELYMLFLNSTPSNDYLLNNSWFGIFNGSLSSASIEVIAGMVYSAADEQEHELYDWFTSDKVGGLEYIIPTDTLYHTHEAQFTEVFSKGDYIREMAYIWSPQYDIKEVRKYKTNDAFVPLYRASELYLKVMECLNRMGKHEIALAMLNKGLKPYWRNDNWLPTISNEYFFPAKLKDVEGFRSRLNLKSIEFENVDESELTLLIEDALVDENLMELSFEGKRWETLLRIAKRRKELGEDPEGKFIAEKVSSKFESPEAMKQKLLEPLNWRLN